MYGGLFKKRPRDSDATNNKEAKVDGLSTASASRTVYHYPSSLPFPCVMDAKFPAESYRSRSQEVKTAIHWGQRKLLLSEIQLLSLYASPNRSYHIVYAGSAPGTHLGFLDELFQCRHTWELIDPGKFDRPVLETRKNFSLRNEFFTNATAYGINARRLLEVLPGLGSVYREVAVDGVESAKNEIQIKLQNIVGTLDVARGTEDIPSMYEPKLNIPIGFELLSYVGMERNKPLFFVSDIRSGSVNLPNFEDHVAENMRAQECWCQILQGEYSMLKFRLPYTHKNIGLGEKRRRVISNLIGPDGTVKYLRGDILLPIWTRPTSTEGRLVVPRGAGQISYNVAHVENQFFFFNTHVREEVHFNHLLLPDEDLDHHYDAAAEVNCLLTYLKFLHPNLKDASIGVLRSEIKRLSASITAHLRVTFQDVIRRREALVLKQASCGQFEEDGDESDNEGTDETPQNGTNVQPKQQEEQEDKQISWVAVAKKMLVAATRERARVLWKSNVNETETDTPSGFWVTTTMKQI
ncbi:mRNA methyltransferase-like [Trypanosoma melophagium]|uniref:mRNA methyltransferase-like n=1 Tax=Trypanosoma melophagium TaxID=715481 RepID=UPI00351A55F3|nr:mRNA methyltransferase-like [Trypanosoma melophagium]